MKIQKYIPYIPFISKKIINIIAIFVFAEFFINAPLLVGDYGLVVAQKYINNKLSYNSILTNLINYPTVFWFGASDLHLKIFSSLGIAISFLALFIDWFVLDFVVWFLFASFLQVFGAFVDINDFVLVEILFLIIFLFKMNLKPTLAKRSAELDFLGAITIRFFVFKLYLGMLFFKIFYNSNKWQDLSFIKFFLQNNPIPTPFGYFVYQLPDWLLQTITFCAIFFQIVIVFLIFAPRKYRIFGFFFNLIYQVFIGLVANLGATNVLSIVVSFILLVDLPKIKSFRLIKIYHFPLLIYLLISISTIRYHFTPPMSSHLSKKFILYKDLESSNWLEKIEIYSFRYKIQNILARFHDIYDDQRDVEFGYSDNNVDYKYYHLHYSIGGSTQKPYFMFFWSGARLKIPLFYYLKNSKLPIWRGTLYDEFPWYENLIKKAVINPSEFAKNYLEEDLTCRNECKYFKLVLNKYEFTNISDLISNGQWWKITPIKESIEVNLPIENFELNRSFYPDR